MSNRAVVQTWGTLIQKPMLSPQLALQYVAIISHPTPTREAEELGEDREGREGWIPAPAQETMRK